MQVLKQDVMTLQEQIQKLLLQSISSFDYAHESFYHGLILGICAIMNNLYQVDSNRESGYGRYDIQLKPYNRSLPGIIVELKAPDHKVNEADIDMELEKSAKEVLEQIERRQYCTAMRQESISSFFLIGSAFSKNI